MDPTAVALPNSFYWIVGVLAVTNVGTIGAVLYMGAKIVWWAAQIDQRTKDNKDILDDHEEQIRQLHHVYR